MQRGRARACAAGDQDGCPVTLNNKSLFYPSHLFSVITNLTEPRGPPQPADLFCFGKQGSREGFTSSPEVPHVKCVNPRRQRALWEELEGGVGFQDSRPVLRRA